MSKDVTYKKETLALIRQLADIQPKIIFERKDDKMILDSRNDSNTVAYEFSCPIDHFNFDPNVNEVTFYDYREFFSLFSVYKDVTIKQNVNNFVMGSGRSKIQYFIAEKEIVEKEYDYVDFPKHHAEFKLTEEKFKKIKTMLNLTKTDNVSLRINDGKLIVKLFGEENQPTCEEEYDLTVPCEDNIEMIITKDIFMLAPENDYNIYINEDGIIKFEYVNNDDIILVLYTTEQEQ